MDVNLAPAIGDQGHCEHPEIPQGLKPSLLRAFAARLNSCPVTGQKRLIVQAACLSKVDIHMS
jgi:hypothetical protein